MGKLLEAGMALFILTTDLLGDLLTYNKVQSCFNCGLFSLGSRNGQVFS